MKRILTILTIAALGVAFTAPAQAAKGKKKGGSEALTKYDTDANRKIDGKEVDAVRTAFAAKEAAAVSLDSNKDGVLSDEEIAAAGGKKNRKNKKKKNK